MSEENKNINENEGGWIYPERRVPPGNAGQRPPDPRGSQGAAPRRGGGVATATRPGEDVRQRAPQNRGPVQQRPQRQGQPGPQRQGQPGPQRQGQQGPQRQGQPAGQQRAAVSRTPAPRTGNSAPRAGIRSSDGSAGVKRKSSNKIPLIIAILSVVALILLILFLVPKNGGGFEPRPETDTETVTETEAETEPVPEAPSAYAERTPYTVSLGSEIECANAILIDLDDFTVVAEKGGDDKIFPASMTKVLTALTAIEKCPNIEAIFTMKYDIVMDAVNANATIAGFYAGEQIPIRDLLYGSILPSGADATRGLAEFVCGSEAQFADMMNAKCAELGLENSHFSNSSGLHADDHYSTCHDIALIMKAAMENPEVAKALGTAEYVTTKTVEHPNGIELHHTLLYERMDGSEEFDGLIKIIGGKTGFTDEAKNCLVTMAEVVSTGKRYIFVCAGGATKWKAVFDTIHVYRTYCGVQYSGEYVSKSER